MDDKEHVEVSPETETREHEGSMWVFYDGTPIVVLGRKKALDERYCFTEPGYQYGRCRMVKSSGDRCRNPVRAGWTVCRYHGAGYASNPGGGTSIGRYSQHLPTRLIDDYEAMLADPEYVSLASDIALVTARINELLEQLDSAGSRMAWFKVQHAMNILSSDTILTMEQVGQAIDLLSDAVVSQKTDEEVWDSLSKLIEQRRKLAETERRRIIDAKRYLTIEQANAMLAFIMGVVFENVTDAQVRRVIADQMKRLNAG